MNLVDWLHNLTVLEERLTRLSAELVREQELTMSFERQFAELRERITRLETWREADRAHWNAELSRFKAEAERVELRLTRMLESGRSDG